MVTIRHDNNGDCMKCDFIFDAYPMFHMALRTWFKDFQKKHPEAHISCAGRGKEAQEALFYKKATRAHYGQSAHNWNCAIDIFCELSDNPDIYDLDWFHNVLAPELLGWMEWYGAPGASFYELPHIEPKDWKEMIHLGSIKLVEEI